MSSINAMNKSNNMLSTAMERLGTGKRINSAADDAAGLQIATRLQGQSNGMNVAKRNISDATALLQTSEGAFDEVSNIMYRMKDLATQAANDTNTQKDRDAINSELNDLNSELGNILNNSLGSLVDSEAQVRFGNDKSDTLPAYCRRCEVKRAFTDKSATVPPCPRRGGRAPARRTGSIASGSRRPLSAPKGKWWRPSNSVFRICRRTRSIDERVRMRGCEPKACR